MQIGSWHRFPVVRPRDGASKHISCFRVDLLLTSHHGHLALQKCFLPILHANWASFNSMKSLTITELSVALMRSMHAEKTPCPVNDDSPPPPAHTHAVMCKLPGQGFCQHKNLTTHQQLRIACSCPAGGRIHVASAACAVPR